MTESCSGPRSTTPTRQTTTPIDSSNAIREYRQRWAVRLLARGVAAGDVPRYGSADWCALSDGPAKIASAVRAAEAWYDHCSPERVAGDLRAELAERSADALVRIRQVSWDVSAVCDWSAVAKRPTHTELVRRRGEA